MIISRFLKSSCGLLGGLLLASLNPASAAQLQDLRHLPSSSPSFLHLLSGGKTLLAFKEDGRSLDFNQRLHVRLQETYAGYPVWGAQVRMHLPPARQHVSTVNLLSAAEPGSVNGFVYQGLEADLQGAPSFVFSQSRAEQALAKAIALHQEKTGRGQMLSQQESHLLIYVDPHQKAHWTYFIQFKQAMPRGLPSKPAYLLDAVTFDVYRSWDNLQTREALPDALAGGFGGNRKIGKRVYDGLGHNEAPLPIKRAAAAHTCYLMNQNVIVKNVRYHDPRRKDWVERFDCKAPDASHNHLFWNGSMDAVNGAFSPSNDALFIGKVIQDMYQQWYGLPPIVKEGKPMTLVMCVHEDMENAYWDGEEMTFGDGGDFFYPLVSLGIGAHEVSHGFTEQNSSLVYYGQSGGLNEAFSDMAAQAAEYYATGSNQWLIGPEIMKEENKALRYMDHPSRDCIASKPHKPCSIERVSGYKEYMDVHFSSGIFNRVFYLIGSAPGWNTRQAFDVMVQANRYYWTATSNFQDAACGVLDATRDYGYPQQAVIAALQAVGLNPAQCTAPL